MIAVTVSRRSPPSTAPVTENNHLENNQTHRPIANTKPTGKEKVLGKQPSATPQNPRFNQTNSYLVPPTWRRLHLPENI
jgi:hypothetical protein